MFPIGDSHRVCLHSLDIDRMLSLEGNFGPFPGFDFFFLITKICFDLMQINLCNCAPMKCVQLGSYFPSL